MILGNVCTRPCGFCSVHKGTPDALEDDEPDRVAEAAHRLGLRHVVITSVTRDDLPDGGADHFRRCVLAVRARTGAAVEVLTPDFLGDLAAVDRVLAAPPEVYNHNMETVPRLYKKVRGRADYQRSLDLLAHVKRRSPATVTKSGLMLGLGETTEELLDVLADLRAVACDTLTLGQYLAPTLKHIPVARYRAAGGVRRAGRAGADAGLPQGRGGAVRALQLPRRRDGGHPARPVRAPPALRRRPRRPATLRSRRRPAWSRTRNAGTRIGRTTNVSSSTPNASAKPSCFISVSEPASSEANVPAMMMPQLEMIGPVRSSACGDAATGPCAACSSWIRVIRKML